MLDRKRELPYELKSKGQPPIVVVNDGRLKDEMHGPWIEWKFPWEIKTTHSLFSDFEELIKESNYI